MAKEDLNNYTMEEAMRKNLERFGRLEKDSKTWLHPWGTYWHLYCPKHRITLIKILSKKYPDYNFSLGECHICNTIYQVINIEKKED